MSSSAAATVGGVSLEGGRPLEALAGGWRCSHWSNAGSHAWTSTDSSAAAGSRRAAAAASARDERVARVGVVRVVRHGSCGCSKRSGGWET
eukprot:6530095-Prymnesium_polylepis.1